MKKIAVIEDDELLNKALVITLEKEGYQVTAAGMGSLCCRITLT